MRSEIAQLKNDFENFVSNDSPKVEFLNDYFNSVFIKINVVIPSNHVLPNFRNTSDQTKRTLLSPIDVKHIIDKVKNKAGARKDNILPTPVLTPVICHFISTFYDFYFIYVFFQSSNYMGICSCFQNVRQVISLI